MRIAYLICPIMMVATLDVSASESLERRFGPDREKGHRSEREFESARDTFKNRDRANYLGVAPASESALSAARTDLHHSPRIGLQR